MDETGLSTFAALLRRDPNKAWKYLGWNISQADAKRFLEILQERLVCKHCGTPAPGQRVASRQQTA
jgi:hypothetical protein